MKRILFPLLCGLLLASCMQEEPLEKTIPTYQLDVVGTAFQTISLTGPLNLYANQDPLDEKMWVVRASVPIARAAGVQLQDLTILVDLQDARRVIIDNRYALTADGLETLLPVLNASVEGDSRMVSFVPVNLRDASVSKKVAKKLLEACESARITVNGTIVTPEVAKKPAAKKVEAKEEPAGPPTLQTLIKRYNGWYLVSEYEKAVKNENKNQKKIAKLKIKDAKDRADKEYNDFLSDQFDDWIDDQTKSIDKKY